SKSNVLPLLLFDGVRNTLTCSSSSSHRSCRLLGMSLQSKYRPWPHQAGPSAHSAPVHRRLIAELGWMYALNSASTAMMSGSVKYVVGGAFGPKSRGGTVTVLGGLWGPCGVCAPAARNVANAPPATRPTV